MLLKRHLDKSLRLVRRATSSIVPAAAINDNDGGLLGV